MSRPPVEPEQEVGPFDFVDDDETRAALEDYLVELRDRQGRTESTVATRRSALRLYVRTYNEVNGTDDLLGPLHDDAARADEMDRVADTFDVLQRREDTLTTHASRRRYVQEVRQFYTHQVTFKGARHNPTDQLERRFGWDSTPEWDNQALLVVEPDECGLDWGLEVDYDELPHVNGVVAAGHEARPSICGRKTRQIQYIKLSFKKLIMIEI
jgi:hypothetical protein